MKNINRSCLTRLNVILIIAMVTIFSCQKSTEPEKEENPPTLPPESSLIMDFSFLDTTTALPKNAPGIPQIASRQNWGWAALNVGIWNAVLFITLAVPVASFQHAFTHSPVLQPDGSWLWSYNFNHGFVQHTANLYGKIENSMVNWQMFLSKQNAYTDFLWYTGESNLPATEGTWILNKNPNDPVAFLDILWHRDPATNTGDIKYTIISPNDTLNESYIFHGVNTDTTRDAFYDIYSKQHDNLAEIEWNRTTKAGRIRDPFHFGNTDWHYWDEKLNDTNPPPGFYLP